MCVCARVRAPAWLWLCVGPIVVEFAVCFVEWNGMVAVLSDWRLAASLGLLLMIQCSGPHAFMASLTCMGEPLRYTIFIFFNFSKLCQRKCDP